jgi:hypothetical protein
MFGKGNTDCADAAANVPPTTNVAAIKIAAISVRVLVLFISFVTKHYNDYIYLT